MIALLISLLTTRIEDLHSADARVEVGDIEAVWVPDGWIGPYVAYPASDSILSN